MLCEQLGPGLWIKNHFCRCSDTECGASLVDTVTVTQVDFPANSNDYSYSLRLPRLLTVMNFWSVFLFKDTFFGKPSQ